jgi:PIN domain nuclease of toxin-antitoxin system
VGRQRLKLLLDTHAFIWAANVRSRSRLSRSAREAIEDRRNETLISAASAWEIATLYRLGRLDAGARITGQWREALADLAARDLAITSEHGVLAGGFAVKHRDPFDRMLAAQAIIEGAHLVTADPAMNAFGAQLLW